MRSKREDAGLCYLCGQPLAKPINRDHVPPKQLLPKSLRRLYRIRMNTLPVHTGCNTAYKHDEEYFIQLLVPFARGSVAGDALFHKTVAEYHAGRKMTVSLANRVLAAFEERPGGVYLPRGKVAFRIEERFWRIVWKIVRGLHFQETGNVLPVEWNVSYTITMPGETPPAPFEAFMHFSREDYGEHKGVFAYRRETLPTEEPSRYWALLFFDRVLITAHFLPPAEAAPEAC
jgi:hypothetical protein